MTIKELSQLYYLNREIDLDRRRLEELEGQRAPSAPVLDGMPHGSRKNASRVEQLAAEIVDLRAIIAAKQIQCIHERQRLERYIADIPDSLTRMVFTLRFVNGLPWAQVASSIGGDNKEDSVKKTCYRYIAKTDDSEETRAWHEEYLRREAARERKAKRAKEAGGNDE